MMRALVLALLVLVLSASAQAGGPQLGLFDDPAFNDYRKAQRRLALDRARDAGARWIRFTVDWSLVAPEGPAKPEDFKAANPFEPRYSWGYVEDFVRDARRRRLRVILTVVRAPEWARTADGPDPRELAAFLEAATQRFSGFFPDPKSRGDSLSGEGRALPAVRRWQIWDEPNGRATPVEARHYRRMLIAGVRRIEAADDSNVAVTAGTAAGSAARVSARAYWRRVLCLTKSLDRAPACQGRLLFDAAAHHPVARNARPRAVRGLRALDRLLARAQALGTLAGSRPKPIWLTSIGWTTRPVDRHGVSRRAQAARLTAALHRLRMRSVPVIWRGLRDTEKGRPPAFPPIASGLWARRDYRDLRRDRPKPAARAFRFPFFVAKTGGRARAWGVAPRGATRVRIQYSAGGAWRTAAVVRARSREAFEVRLKQRRGTFRARGSGVISLKTSAR